MDTMASALIHLANKDYYTSLVDDFIALDVLPMERARSQRGRSSDGQSAHSLCRGGGAKEYEKELRRIYGLDQLGLYAWWFPSMTQDAITVFNDIPSQSLHTSRY
eukprot:scaffold100_cov162-Ochromonas_danica.AAC.5